MTEIISTAFAFDQRELTLNSIAPGLPGAMFFDDTNATYNGVVYEDALAIQWTDSTGTPVVSVLAGSSLTYNASVLSGPVTGYFELYFNGVDLEVAFSIQNFNIDGADFIAAISTPSRVDDEALIASVLAGDDSFTLSAMDDYADGMAGADSLYGFGGNDTLIGGDGNDLLSGGEGFDSLSGDAGNDSLTLDAGNDTIDGGTGIDWLVIGGATNSKVNLAQLGQQNTGYGVDVIANVENISGGSAIDRLFGGGEANTFSGNDGNDFLYGRGGDDTLSGDAGNDRLYGGDDNDSVNGGAGNDRLYVDDGNDVMDGDAGVDWLFFTATADGVVDLAITTAQNTGYGNDTILNIENVSGGKGNDVISGTATSNSLRGGIGNDELYGRGGNDQLRGNAGADVVVGGTGRDYMYAGIDTDRDLFVFNDITETVIGSQRDRIYQFASGEDDVDLSAIDADTSLAGKQDFVFSSAGAAANSVWIVDTGVNKIVRGDVDGNGIVDFEIMLVGVAAVDASDFVF